jgi:Domain of unknown function (DUF4150)
MATEEAARKIDDAVVVSTTPCVCLTPLGGQLIPVPYPIVARLGASVSASPNVRFNGYPAFTMASYQPRVEGHEAGVRGMKSGVLNGKAIPVGHSTTVRANQSWVVRHDSEFDMNCP